MNLERVPYLSLALMIEYTKILAEVFPGVSGLPAFAEAFNSLNFQYQSSAKQKLVPAAILEKKISCSPTTMLMGIQEELQGRTPTYLVVRGERGQTGGHTLLKSNDFITNPYWEMWLKEKFSPNCVVVPVTEPEYFINTFDVLSTRVFFANRLRFHGLSKCAIAGLEQHRPVIEKIGGSGQVFSEYLKELHATRCKVAAI